VIVFIVGTKIDLGRHRIVSQEEGLEFATSRGLDYCEISSKTHDFVDLERILFSKMIAKLYERDKEIIKKGNPLDVEKTVTLRKSVQRFNCCS